MDDVWVSRRRSNVTKGRSKAATGECDAELSRSEKKRERVFVGGSRDQGKTGQGRARRKILKKAAPCSCVKVAKEAYDVKKKNEIQKGEARSIDA